MTTQKAAVEKKLNCNSIINIKFSGGSRISCRGHRPIGGMDLQHGHFLAKMYAKMKELGPVGGGMCRAHPPPIDPPMKLP